MKRTGLDYHLLIFLHSFFLTYQVGNTAFQVGKSKQVAISTQNAFAEKIVPCRVSKCSKKKKTSPTTPKPSITGSKSPTTEDLRRIHCCRTCDNRRYNTCTFSVEVEVTVTGGPPEDRITTAGEVTWREIKTTALRHRSKWMER